MKYITDLIPSFPLTDPIAIFLLVIVIILCAPILNRFKIPHIIGLILAGTLFGPHGLNILSNDASFELFGKVGILYIMFQAGLEIDLNTFKQNSTKSILFGIYTPSCGRHLPVFSKTAGTSKVRKTRPLKRPLPPIAAPSIASAAATAWTPWC